MTDSGPTQPSQPSPPPVHASVSPQPVAPASPPPPPPPRIWPVLVVSIAVFPAVLMAMLFAGGVVLAVAMARWDSKDEAMSESAIYELMAQQPIIMLVLLIPMQLVILAAAVVPALLSPEVFTRRLALVRGASSLRMLPALMLGTVFVMLLSAMAMNSIFREPSPALEQFGQTLAEAQLWQFLALLAFITLAPAVGEELLFRGYIQRRLLQRWPAVAAIGFSSLMFALIHMDVQHVVGVLPIGIWLGVIAWRTGSVWPCIVCHGFNNLVAGAMVRVGGLPLNEDFLSIVATAAMGLCLIGWIVAVVQLVRCRRSGARI